MRTNCNLSAGVKLASVSLPPSPTDEGLTYSVYKVAGLASFIHCDSITVVHENGQMDTVPWAYIEREDRKPELINLALAEGVQLLEES